MLQPCFDIVCDTRQTIDRQEAEHGARFHHPTWWKSWYDPSFKSEHLDPSHEIDFTARVNWLFDAYSPVVRQIADRFVGQGRDVDSVFRNSLAGQVRYLSEDNRASLLSKAEAAKTAPGLQGLPYFRAAM